MKLFSFNPEPMSGFRSDKDNLSGEAFGSNVGNFISIITLIFALMFIFVAPFFIILFLDKFVDTIVVNNALFFMLIGIWILVSKLFTKTFSQNMIVRLAFSLYIIIAVLYVLLYRFNLQAVVYSYARVLSESYINFNRNLLKPFLGEKMNALTEGNWLYHAVVTTLEKFAEIKQWSIEKVFAIDNSALSAPITEINILLALKCIVLYLVFGALVFVVHLGGWLLLILSAVSTIAMPYVIALFAVAIANNMIYRIKKLYYKKLKD